MATGSSSTSASSLTFQDKVKDQLTCSVCLELFTDPRTLFCLHSFCLDCLRGLDLQKREGKEGREIHITCPACRKYTKLPRRGGISKLPTAFYLNSLIGELETSASQKGNVTSETCQIHHGEECRIYCEDCKVLICINCALLSHKNHDYDLIENVHRANLEEFKRDLSLLQREINDSSERLKKLATRGIEIEKMKGSLKTKVNDYSEKLIALIRQRQEEKLNQIDTIINEKMKELDDETLQIRTIHDWQKNVHASMNSVLKDNDDPLKLMVEKEALKKFMSTMMEERPRYTSDNEAWGKGSKVRFIKNVTFSKGIDDFGCFLAEDVDYQLHYSSPLMSGEQGTIYLSHDMPNSSDSLPKLTCTLTSFDTGHVTLCKVGKDDSCNGRYPISFIPTTRGEHTLTVIREDIKKEKRFSIDVHPSPDTIDKSVFIGNNFNKPRGIAFGNDEDSYVVDSGSNSVLWMSDIDEVKTQLPVSFINPWGIAVTREGYILVTDEHRLQMIASGCVVASVGGTRSGYEDHKLDTPKGIAVHPETGRIYLADSGNNRVMIYDNNLEFLGKFGSKGYRLGRLYEPTDLAFNKSGSHLFVVNHYAHSIDVFTPHGQPVRRIGLREESVTGSSPGSGELSYPMAIAIDALDNIYVTEVQQTSIFSMKTFCDSRISVYRADGTFIRNFGRKGRSEKDLRDPCGIGIDEFGNLYVCDTRNNRIIVM